MTTTRRRMAGLSDRSTASLHASQDEATDRLYWLLMQLDAGHTVPWGEVERRAITCAGGALPWRLVEGAALAHLVAELRGRSVNRA